MDCLCCREVAGDVDLPGGLLYDDAGAICFHIPPMEQRPRPYLGHLMVVTRRHVDHLGDLTDEEATSVARAARTLAAALRAEGVERVHVAVIGTGVPHFHLHLFPRYPETPPDAEWTALDDLPDAPHGGAAEIEQLAARLTRRLRSWRAA